MPTSKDLALVDANVLVYAFCDEAEHYAACSSLLDQAQNAVVAFTR